MPLRGVPRLLAEAFPAPATDPAPPSRIPEELAEARAVASTANRRTELVSPAHPAAAAVRMAGQNPPRQPGASTTPPTTASGATARTVTRNTPTGRVYRWTRRLSHGRRAVPRTTDYGPTQPPDPGTAPFQSSGRVQAKCRAGTSGGACGESRTANAPHAQGRLRSSTTTTPPASCAAYCATTATPRRRRVPSISPCTGTPESAGTTGTGTAHPGPVRLVLARPAAPRRHPIVPAAAASVDG